jgi:hypothetical protein
LIIKLTGGTRAELMQMYWDEFAEELSAALRLREELS